MARYKMDDGSIANTELARIAYTEATRWDGNNHISVPTGSQWHHETLYYSAKGRWYLVSTSKYQNETPSAHWVTPLEAATWLLLNDHELPEELQGLSHNIEE